MQGTGPNPTSSWIVDSDASNHMTGSVTGLHSVHEYGGEEHIQIVGGNTLPITAIGNLGSSFRNVFVTPGLSTSLIFVGQLVDNN